MACHFSYPKCIKKSKSTNSSRCRYKKKIDFRHSIHRMYKDIASYAQVSYENTYSKDLPNYVSDLVLWIDSFLHGNKGNVVFASPRKHISKDTKTQTVLVPYTVYTEGIQRRTLWTMESVKLKIGMNGYGRRRENREKSMESYIITENTHIRVYFIDARIFSHIPT